MIRQYESTLARLAACGLMLVVPMSLPAQSDSSVTLTLASLEAHATPIPADFAGLSIEADAVRSDWNSGKDIHTGWLVGGVTAYSTLLKTLGVHSIRIGGNSAEEEKFRYPTTLDASHVNDFCHEIGANLIWTLPVESRYDVALYTSFAETMIHDRNSKGYTYQTTFAIGNEPDINHVDQPTWQARFDAYFNALYAAIGPSVRIAGSGGSGDVSYTNNMTEPYSGAKKANIGYKTMHSYPERGSKSYPNVDAAVDKLLSSSNEANYLALYNKWGPVATGQGFATRLEETNSMFNGGFSGASNTLAAALWALDYLGYMSSATTLEGMNFHVGNGTGGAYNPMDPVGASSSYTLRGVGYAMLAFHQYANGRVIPVTLTATPAINLSAYAVLQSDGSARVAIINRTHASSTSSNMDATVTIDPGKPYTHAQIMYLTVPHSDPTAVDGIALGGQGVTTDGTWSGSFTQTLRRTGGRFVVSVPHTSAAVVRLY